MTRVAMLVLLIVFAPFSYSANKIFLATVDQVMIDDTAFGGCMIKITPDAAFWGLDCKVDWVTMSCTGDLNPKQIGNQKLSAAQLALVTRQKVNLNVVDTKKHNGYCFVRRIDNFPGS